MAGEAGRLGEGLVGAWGASGAGARLVALWGSGGVPPVAEVAREVLGLAGEAEGRRALVFDAERRREAGVFVLEEYVAALPGLEGRPGWCRALLMHEVVGRAGEAAWAVEGDLVRRFPWMAGEVAAVVELVLLADEASSGDGVGAGGEVGAGGDEELSPGSRLGRYVVVERLGRGGFGTCYLAEDTRLGRRVALKVLFGRGEGAMLAEAQAAAAVEHPGVVAVHGAEVIEGRACIDCALVGEVGADGVVRAGWSLEEEVRRRGGGLGVRRAVEVMEGVAWAVAAAHARGVLHRDVKPGNVLLTPSGRALIGDFGLATAVVTAKAGRVVGTPGFMAPEQVRGEAATPRSDVWGLGATLGYALMGRWPAGLEGLPGDVRAVVERATAGEAGARYTSAEGLAVDLRAVLEGRGTVARPPGAVRGAVMWARRHAAPVVVGVLGVVVALGLTARFVWRLEGERDRAVKAEREAMVAARVAATAAAAAEGAALEAARQRDVALMLNRFTGEVTGAALRMYEDRAVTLQEALALAERRVGYSLAGRPLLEAAAKQFLGGAALAAGDAAKARGLLVRAVEIREGALGRDAAETLRSRRLLALTEGERAEAETAGLLPTLEERLGVADPDVCAAKLYLGVAAAKRGDLERAEGLLRAAVGGLKAGGNEGTLDWQEAAGNLGQVMLSRGDVEGGLGQFRSVVEEVERLLGEGDVRALNARHNLARAYVRVERLSEAEAELRGLRERSVRLLGDTHSGAIFAATALGEFLLQKRREAGGAEEALVLARGAIPEKVRGMVTVGARYRAELLEGSALAALGRLGEAEGVLAGIVKDAERRKVTGNVSVRAAAESLEKVRAARGRGE